MALLYERSALGILKGFVHYIWKSSQCLCMNRTQSFSHGFLLNEYFVQQLSVENICAFVLSGYFCFWNLKYDHLFTTNNISIIVTIIISIFPISINQYSFFCCCCFELFCFLKSWKGREKCVMCDMIILLKAYLYIIFLKRKI